MILNNLPNQMLNNQILIPTSYCSNLVCPVDLYECFFVTRKKYNMHALQDVANSYLKCVNPTSEKEKEIILELLTTPKMLGSIYSDSKYNYCLKSGGLPQYLKGKWWTNDGSCQGDSLFSMARTIKGCSDIEAFLLVSNIQHVDFSEKNVAQVQSLENHSFIADAQGYLDDFTCHDTLVIPATHTASYPFCNNYGKLSSFLHEFNLNGETFQQFATLQQNDITGERVFKFIAPPSPYMIYNFHLIINDTSSEVHIYDLIDRACFANSEQAIATWSGNLSISSLLDWSCLKGRKVRYLYDDENIESCLIGVELHEKFKTMGSELKLSPLLEPYK